MTTHNLPRQSTSFVGRNKELAEIRTLLENPACQLLTLLGTGGIGKTRLAIEAGTNQLPHFAHSVYFIALSPVNSPALMVSAIASALQVSFHGAEDTRSQIISYLAEKQMLLIMDNFEHLLEGADLLIAILQSAAHVKFLVTSRERLNIQEEWVLALEGLSFPEGEANQPLEAYGAVQLFVQRACQINAGFSISDNVEAVKTICQRLEGMPLGLELAASWLRVMSCQQIAVQLTESFDFLTTPLRNVPERHRSLRAVFEHSWILLSPSEKDVLMRLSVFRGGFDLEAAEQVAGASLPLLAGLADKSLIRLNANERYDLHELLRQYAVEKLIEAGTADTTAQRHGAYFLKLATEAEAHNFGREQIDWFDRMENELDNLRTVLNWSLQSGHAEMGLQTAAALGWFFSERVHWSEGLDWLERLLTANPDAPASLRAKAFHSAGALAGLLEDEAHTRALIEQALILARSANDRWNIAWSLCHLGNYIVSDSDQSAALLEESLGIFRELGDAMGIAHALGRRAWKAIQEQRDYAYGRVLLEEAATLTYEAGDQVLTAWLQYFLGLLFCLQDRDLVQAKIHFETCMLLFREARSPFHEPLILLADVEQALGNTARAQLLYAETLTALQGNMIIHPYLSWVLVGLVSVARSLGQFERAAQLLGAANSIGLDTKRNSPDVADFGTGAAVMAAMRDQLGEAAFAEAWAAGNAMTAAQIITYALEDSALSIDEEANTLEKAQSRKTVSPLLSEREQAILKLVADGLSNREIAERLVLALSTVKWYINEIFSKLNVNSRTQAVKQAREIGLLS